MARLDHLPAELIAQIASLTDVKTVLSLSRTSKALRRGSYDATVLKPLFVNVQSQVDHPSYTSVTVVQAAANDDAGSWARYALALEQEVSPSKRILIGRKMQNWQYTPKLWPAELYFIWQSHHKLSSSGFGSHDRDGEDTAGGNMLSLIGKSYGCLMGDKTPTITPDLLVRSFKNLCHFFVALYLIPEWSLDTPRFKMPNPGQFPLMPFTSAYALPRPFDDDAAWSIWYHAHTHAMWAEELASPSEWAGCYSTTRSCEFPTHLTDVRLDFTTLSEKEAEDERATSNEIKFEAIGIRENSHWPNLNRRLWGVFWEDETGGIRIEAQSTSTRTEKTMRWYLYFTPIGILGRSEYANFIQGPTLIWLWKKKWTQ